jgi:diguanylate cyclase (GGDEF)-like protein
MGDLIDQNKRDKVFLSLLILLYITAAFVQTAIPTIVIGSDRYSGIINPEKMQIIAVSGILIGLFQLLDSVELVTSCRMAGFWAQLILNCANVVLVIFAVFAFRQYLAIPGIAISLVAVIICLIIKREITQLDANVEQLHRWAFTDDLTGLSNRKERVLCINNLISGSHSVPVFSIVLCDFDNFKMINDSLGHQIGDALITEVVHNMLEFVKAPVTLGRMGGDEFLFIIPGGKNEEEIDTYIMQICGVLSHPFRYKNRDYRITASFGVSRYPKDSDTSVVLLQQVEMALYRAKAQGKNRIVFFDEEMQQTIEHHLCMERELHAAIDKNELYVEYQPQYTIPARRLRGFEVLARWDSEALGQIAPLDFIPIAEENGTIIEIGKWILEKSCSQYVKILHEYDVPPTLSVNISVVQFRDPEFVENIKYIIRQTGMDPENLELEITESVCINSPEIAKRILTELKKLGIRIALDDFGTGYSSLSYLRLLPFDIVKIDKSFIDTIGIIPDGKNIVRTIIGMAHQLDLGVIAEGVETLDQFEYLVRNQCDFVQGNYLGKPAPIAAL